MENINNNAIVNELPAQRVFLNREDLINYLKDFAFNNGFGVFISDSKFNKYLLLRCLKGVKLLNLQVPALL